MSGTLVKGKVTVAPAQFVHVKYDAAEIAALVTDLAEQLGSLQSDRVDDRRDHTVSQDRLRARCGVVRCGVVRCGVV